MDQVEEEIPPHAPLFGQRDRLIAAAQKLDHKINHAPDGRREAAKEDVASELALIDNYNPNTVDPTRWMAIRGEYEARAERVIAVYDAALRGEAEGESELLRAARDVLRSTNFYGEMGRTEFEGKPLVDPDGEAEQRLLALGAAVHRLDALFEHPESRNLNGDHDGA